MQISAYSYEYAQETQLYYLQSRYYNPNLGRFLNADALYSTGQGLLGNNMFVYCLNNPVTGIDSNGMRTYFINGIGNEEEEDPPYYAEKFSKLLEDKGVSDVRTIAVYNGQTGLLGYALGILQVALEMSDKWIYSYKITQNILNDLENEPLADGEQLNLIGFSGGGQIALNVEKLLGGKVDNVVLIGAPIVKVFPSTASTTVIYSGLDFLSWDSAGRYRSYFAGWIPHDEYFYSNNIDRVATMVSALID